MVDEISPDTPCDVPEKVLLLIQIAFDCQLEAVNYYHKALHLRS